MKCLACNKLLSNFESTRKIMYMDTNKIEYIDMCTECYSPSYYGEDEDSILSIENYNEYAGEYDEMYDQEYNNMLEKYSNKKSKDSDE